MRHSWGLLLLVVLMRLIHPVAAQSDSQPLLVKANLG